MLSGPTILVSESVMPSSLRLLPIHTFPAASTAATTWCPLRAASRMTALPILPAAPATQSLSIGESLPEPLVVQSFVDVYVEIVCYRQENLRVGFVYFACRCQDHFKSVASHFS